MLALLVSSTACAIDTHGLARVSMLENATTRVLRVEAWGAHWITHPADAGLTLGHSRREYIYAREPAAVGEVGFACTPLTPAPVTAAPPERDDELLFVDVRTEGLALDANQTRVGVSLGLRRRTALRIPAESDLVFAMSFDSQHGGTRCASLKRREP